MLVNGTLPTLVDGVSQLPPSQRKATQCDIAENCMMSPADGLSRRPPFNHVGQIADLTGAFRNKLKVHFINRSETEQYLLCLDNAGTSTSRT